MRCYSLILLLFLGVFNSCESVSIKPDSTKLYKMSLYMASEDKAGEGTLVLPRRDSYAIYVESDGRINYLIFRTCSREITIEDPRQGLSRKKFTIKYTPNEIEKSSVCQSEIMALNINGQNALGLIDYEDPTATLQATNICGSTNELTAGVSMCQERQNMIEKIKFDVEVIASPNNCNLDRESGKEFTYSMPLGRCIIAFVEKKSPYRIHRHTLIGYEEQLISL